MPARHTPLAALLTTAVAVTMALGWFGWKLFDSQRAAEEQRLRERIENGADALAGAIRGSLAEIGDQMTDWLSDPDSALPDIAGGVVVAVTDRGIGVKPSGALPFIPKPRDRFGLVEPSPADFLEFQLDDPAAAAAAHRPLTTHQDQTVRAVALHRFARALRKSHDMPGALDAYRRLEGFGQADADGYPAELAALDGQRLTLADSGRHDEAQRIGERIVAGIDQGRWSIARATAETFRDGLSTSPRPESWSLADALANQWEQWRDHTPERGLSVASGDGRPMLLTWRARDGNIVALVGFAEQILPSSNVQGIAFALTDAEGQRIAGGTPPPSSVTRVTGDASSPWELKVWASGDRESGAPLVSASTVTSVVGTTVVLFLWSTVYFTARAMRREAHVAQLQSDFVSAVSHEFRSPLTTIRQLAELLEMNEVPSEERRRTYYEVLARESRRLQRLVETLLNFGRMEAGAERYRQEVVSVPHLIREVAREVEAQHGHDGWRVEISGPDEGVNVRGDADALALTIRNLLDNAVKYSPGADRVRVEWAVQGNQVSIRVADQGLGIKPSERDAIFGRFVRGHAAAAANVKGTGVGLAMVRHVVTAHGGQVSVESEVGRGSTFTVLLPVVN